MGTKAKLLVGWASVALVACGPQELLVDEDPLPPHGEVNPSFAEQELASMPACGTALAEFQGTVAYSNGQWTGTGTSCNGTGSYGYRYQCVELVMRHFKTNWGLRWYGNAKDLLRNAPRDSVAVYNNGDLDHPPVPGDMLVWTQGTYGHVALITAVRPTELDIVEQNVTGRGKTTLTHKDFTIAPRWTTWVPAGWAHAKANGATNPPHDAGTAVDAGAPVVDAGTPRPDAGTPRPDAGTPSVDAGNPEVDAGTPPPPPPAWSCAKSSYAGKQYWTCSEGSRNRCTGGVAEREQCAFGCMVRTVGTDDLCISAGTGWNCNNSSYGQKQYWTCSAGSIYKCENGSPRVVRCPSGCNVRALGSDDDCR